MKKHNRFLPHLLAFSAIVAPFAAFAQSSTYTNPFVVGGVSIKTVPDALFTLVDAALLILTPIAVVMIIYSGFLFVTAQGNEAKLSVAKRTLFWSVIGLFLVLGVKVLGEAIKQTICSLIAPPLPSWC
jgi:hypothetical protein